MRTGTFTIFTSGFGHRSLTEQGHEARCSVLTGPRLLSTVPDATRGAAANPGPIDQVWAVLTNGWMYSGWVVGASRIRDVDAEFPGSRQQPAPVGGHLAASGR